MSVESVRLRNMLAWVTIGLMIEIVAAVIIWA